MSKSATTGKTPKIVVIGGGTGLPVLLDSLKDKNVDLTAIVTVADNGGSSGIIRDYINVVPPGDIRNCLVSLSSLPVIEKELFQYRFDSSDQFFSGHAIGNLIIAALTEMRGGIYSAVQELGHMMRIRGHVYPAADEALMLHALFEDGSTIDGEHEITQARKKIKRVWVTPTNGKRKVVPAPSAVIQAIEEADMVVLGPGSLFTSILPNLMLEDIGNAIKATDAEVVYICNIMTQLGETEHFTDAEHVRVLNSHLKKHFINTVLVNTEAVPEAFMHGKCDEEYLVQVEHDFQGLRDEGCRVISADFLKLKDDKGAFHDGELVGEELMNLVYQPRTMG